MGDLKNNHNMLYLKSIWLLTSKKYLDHEPVLIRAQRHHHVGVCLLQLVLLLELAGAVEDEGEPAEVLLEPGCGHELAGDDQLPAPAPLQLHRLVGHLARGAQLPGAETVLAEEIILADVVIVNSDHDVILVLIIEFEVSREMPDWVVVIVDSSGLQLLAIFILQRI